MSDLKGVAVGAGYFSRFHLDAWSRIEGVAITAICDTDESVARRAASRHDVPHWYTDLEQMLDAERPDFVDIITRPDSHLEVVQDAASRGAAIICQKPLAPSLPVARQLVMLAHNAGVRLMVHENFRFQPWYREIRRLLDEGAIGDRLHSIYFRCRTGDGWGPRAYLDRQPYFRTMPRLLVFETGVHFVDTFRYLAGEIDGVYASLHKRNPEIAGEDAATVMFEFRSGAEGVWDGNRFNDPDSKDARYTFGNAWVEGNGGTIRLYGNGRLTRQPLGEEETDHSYRCPKRGFAGDCVRTTQQHFVDSLIRNTPFETGGDEYLKTLSIVEAIYRSAEMRQPIRGLSYKEVSHANR